MRGSRHSSLGACLNAEGIESKEKMGSKLCVLFVYLCCTYSAISISGENSTLTLISLLPARPDQLEEDTSLYLAGRMAVDLINHRTDLLPDLKVELVEVHSGCEQISNTTFNLLDALRSNQPFGIAGPLCSESSKLISTLNSNNFLLPSVHIAGIVERKSPLTFAMLPSILHFVHASLSFNTRNNWNRIAVMFDESSLFYRSIANTVRSKVVPEAAQNVLITSVHNNIIPFDTIVEERIRIIYLLVGPKFMRNVLCIALHKSISYPAYQWVIIARSDTDLRPVQVQFQGRQYNCNSTQMNSAANRAIFMHYNVNLFDETKSTDTNLTTKEFTDIYQDLLNHHNISISRKDYLVSVYFDSLWAFAFALNNSRADLLDIGLQLSDISYKMHGGIEILRRYLSQVRFEGLSGTIDFQLSNESAVEREIIIYLLREDTLIPIESWNDMTSQLYSLINITIDHIEDTFTKFGEVVIVVQWLLFLILMVDVLGLAFLVLLHILTIVYRNSPSVKATSLKITQFAFIGCYLCSFSSIFLSITEIKGLPPHIKCSLNHVLSCILAIGLTMIFSTICAKTWRLYRIFVHYLDPGTAVSNKFLAVFILVTTSIELIIVIAWLIKDPLYYTVIPFPQLAKRRITCIANNYFTWFPIVVSYNGFFIVLAMFLALLCHRIPNKEFRTNSIITLVYIISPIIIIGCGIFFTSPPNLNINRGFLALSLMILLIVYCTAFLLFFLPLYPVFKGKLQSRKSVNRNRKSSSCSTAPLDHFY